MPLKMSDRPTFGHEPQHPVGKPPSPSDIVHQNTMLFVELHSQDSDSTVAEFPTV